jgi:hypothetical protein
MCVTHNQVKLIEVYIINFPTLILFHCWFAGIYLKIFGRGTQELNSQCLVQFLKFETSSKSFKVVAVDNLSTLVDAVVLDDVSARFRT